MGIEPTGESMTGSLKIIVVSPYNTRYVLKSNRICTAGYHFLAQKSSEEKKIGIEEIALAIDSPRPFYGENITTTDKR